ncbi:MAG: hypothetical protein ACREFG_10730, partial [Chthoniobacterales bacterium]
MIAPKTKTLELYQKFRARAISSTTILRKTDEGVEDEHEMLAQFHLVARRRRERVRLTVSEETRIPRGDAAADFEDDLAIFAAEESLIAESRSNGVIGAISQRRSIRTQTLGGEENAGLAQGTA